MKTAKQLQTQIDELISETNKGMRSKIPSERLSDAQVKRNKKRIEFLRNCRNYLETNPTEQFVQKMHDELVKRKQIVDDGFQAELDERSKNEKFNPKSESFKQFKKDYHNERDYKHITEQLHTVKYILSDLVV